MPEYVRKIEDLHQKKESLPKKSERREKKEDPALKEYHKQAKERGVEELKKGDWMSVDSMAYSRFGFDQATYLKNTSPAAKQRRMDQLGTYSVANGLIATVDTHGAMRIGPATAENIALLKQAKFTEGKFPVPFSLGEQPIDEQQKKELADMRKRGMDARLEEVREKHIAMFQEKARQQGIKPVEGGVWMEADGIIYETLSKTQGTIERNSDGYNISSQRMNEVGTYDANNGMLAYVNEQGVLCVGKMTEQNLDALQKAGYGHYSLFVPFSNGERPVGDLLYRRLKDVRTGKPEDVREAERELLVRQRITERKTLFGDAAVIPPHEEVYNRVAYEGIALEKNIDAILEKRLHPKTERDDAGFDRNIYTYGDVSFSFKGREEMPLTRTAVHSRTTVLGEAPHLISEEKYQRYLHTVEMTRMQKNAPEHSIANKTLIGVIELAQTLGSKDASLEQLKQEIKTGVYSERALALMDVLIATDMNVSAGGEVSNEGEPLVVLALLGDKDAQEALVREMDILHAVRGREKFLLPPQNRDMPPMPVQELVCVHATKYQPQRRADGAYEIPTTFDATEGKMLRNSVHTALNHKVESHMYGSWEGVPYVVVAPMDAMIQQNGLPEVLHSVDTWWVRNPGEKLAFPQAYLVKPAEENFSGNLEVHGNEVVFKNENFTLQDLGFMYEKMQQDGWSVGRSFITSLYRTVHNFYEPNFGTGHKNPDGSLKFDASGMDAVLKTYFKEYEDITRFFMQEKGKQPVNIEERVREIFSTPEMIKHIYGDSRIQKQHMEEIVSYVVKNLKSFCYDTMNRLAVNEAISRLGCKVEEAGSNSWAGSGAGEREDQLDALAYQLKLATGQHTGTPQQRITEQQGWSVKQGLAPIGETGGEWSMETFDWKKFQPGFGNLIGNLDQKSLRMLYASGLLVARENQEKEQKAIA